MDMRNYAYTMHILQATPSTACVLWGLTFDMSGRPKGAKRPLERPLDGRVRRHPFDCANSLASWRTAQRQERRAPRRAQGKPGRTETSLGRPASAVLVGRTNVREGTSHLDGGFDLTGETLAEPLRVLLVVRCLGLKFGLGLRVEASRFHFRICRTRAKTSSAGTNSAVPASTSAIRL